MEEQKTKIIKDPKKHWTVLGAILFALYLFSIIALIFLRRTQTYYLDGLNGTNIGGIRLFYSTQIWLLMVLLFVLMVYVYFKIVFKNGGILSRRFKYTLIAILLVLNPVFVFISFSNNAPHREKFLHGYRDWALSILDIDEIRVWMEQSDGRGSFVIGENFQGPKCLIDNYSRFSYGIFYQNESEQTVLRFGSGGGFQDWGIEIGPKEIPILQSICEKELEEYRLKVEDGVYVWSGQ